MPELKNARKEALAQAVATAGNGKAAARLLGKTHPAASAGVTNAVRGDPAVAARVQEIVRTRYQEQDVTARRVITELARVAFASAKDIFNEDGDLIPVHLMTDDAAASISGIDVEVRWEGKGDSAVPITIKKVRRADKMAALNTLAKHFKVIGDEGDGVNALASALADRLNAAKKRVRPQEFEDIEEVPAFPPPAPPLPPAPPTEQDQAEPPRRPRGRPRKIVMTPAQDEPKPQENDDEQLW